ncbi:hypothetical protein PK35_gp70 [Geobacillus phage vB_GthS_PK3.5]|nr:hypothetical protein PK35_gp70 [Geobacillus phage vB_GthS_PK3.5]
MERYDEEENERGIRKTQMQKMLEIGKQAAKLIDDYHKQFAPIENLEKQGYVFELIEYNENGMKIRGRKIVRG